MIYYSETPTRQNKLSAVLALCCAVAGVALLSFSRYLPYVSLVQTAAFVLCIVAVSLAARACLRYTYRLQRDEGDGKDELAVIQIKGKRSVTVCRLLVTDLKEIDVVTPENEKGLRAKYRADRVHALCPDLCPPRSVYLLFEESGNRIVLRLQASEELLLRLKALANPAI